MDQFYSQFQSNLGGSINSILGALAVFLLGWIIALLIAAVVRKALAAINLNGRLNRSRPSASATSSNGNKGTDFERIAARLVFWLILIAAITGALSILRIDALSGPFANLLNQITTYLPRLIGAGVLALVGWIIATGVRSAITYGLNKTDIDERLNQAGVVTMSQNIASIAYWLILLLWLPLVLGVLGLYGLLDPLNNMITNILDFIPNLFTAAIIGFVGYVIAKIVRGLVTGLVSSLDLQSLANRTGLGTQTNIANLAGMVVFFLIMISVIIAALDALRIKSISEPAINMLNQLMSAIPDILGAVLIVTIMYVIARFVASIVTSLLQNSGVDQLPARIGLSNLMGDYTLSRFVGHVIIFITVLFALIEAANRLGFGRMSDILTMFIAFSGDIFLGVVILSIGFWIASTLANLVMRSPSGSVWLANLVRVLIMGLVIAMGLRAMGIADSIVNLAFALTLGSVAVAFALAFGLGGREAAARLTNKLVDSVEGEVKKDQPTPPTPPTPPSTDSL